MNFSEKKYYEILENNNIMTIVQAKEIIKRLENNESFYFITQNTKISQYKIKKFLLPFIENYNKIECVRYRHIHKKIIN